MATHSSVLAWRIPGMGEPGGLPSMGWHRVGHDWSDLAAAAAAVTSDARHLFMYLWPFVYILWKNICSGTQSILKLNNCFFFFTVECMSSLYILYINFLVDLYFTDFLLFHRLSLHFFFFLLCFWCHMQKTIHFPLCFLLGVLWSGHEISVFNPSLS